MDRTRRWGRILALTVVAGFVGYLIGPPIVNAAVGVTKIQHGKKGNQANVRQGRLWVQPRGGFTDVTGSAVTNVPIPVFGVDRFAAGTGNELACDTDSVVTEIVLHGDGASDFTVTVTGDTDFDGADDVIWEGTVGSGGHVADSFASGVYSATSLSVAVSGTPGDWLLYGFCFGTSSNLPAGAQAAARSSGT